MGDDELFDGVLDFGRVAVGAAVLGGGVGVEGGGVWVVGAVAEEVAEEVEDCG